MHSAAQAMTTRRVRLMRPPFDQFDHTIMPRLHTPAHVHDLDSYGPSHLGAKVIRFAGSSADAARRVERGPPRPSFEPGAHGAGKLRRVWETVMSGTLPRNLAAMKNNARPKGVCA